MTYLNFRLKHETKKVFLFQKFPRQSYFSATGKPAVGGPARMFFFLATQSVCMMQRPAVVTTGGLVHVGCTARPCFRFPPPTAIQGNGAVGHSWQSASIKPDKRLLHYGPWQEWFELGSSGPQVGTLTTMPYHFPLDLFIFTNSSRLLSGNTNQKFPCSQFLFFKIDRKLEIPQTLKIFMNRF